MAFKLERLTAFVSVAPDGDEGVIGAQLAPGEWIPFIGADEERIKQIYPIAVDLCNRKNIQLKIIQFDNRIDVTEEFHDKYGPRTA